jgi:hypothetical protein
MTKITKDRSDTTTRPVPTRELGATGEFPDGKISEDDEGELRMAVAVHEGNVILDFGKNISWIGLPPEQAKHLGQLLIQKAKDLGV